MRILEITVNHRSDDTRIYQKYVSSLLESRYEVGYISPDPPVKDEPGLFLLEYERSTILLVRMYRLIKKIPDILKFQPDFVHVHDPEILLLTPVLHSCGLSVIYDMHENFYRELDDKRLFWLNKWAQKLVWRAIEKFILGRIIVVFAERSYAKYFGHLDRVATVQNFPREASALRRFKPRKKPHRKPKFVYLGTISNDRGALRMVRALEIAFGCDNYELHFIGEITDASIEPELFEVFNGNANIVFHGYQPMRRAWEICNACDVGLAILDAKANYIESYPTKLFEYLICGLPIVTSNFDLYRGLVEKYNVGFCVNPSDDTEIAENLSAIVEYKMYARLTTFVDRFPFNRFTWEQEFRKFSDFLRSA